MLLCSFAFFFIAPEMPHVQSGQFIIIIIIL